MRSARSILSLALAVGLCAAVPLGIAAYQARSSRQTDREMLQLSVEDVARRVQANIRNYQSIRALTSEASLSKARAFSDLIFADASILADQKRLNECARSLDVDELHVTDAAGVFIAGVPNIYLGRRISESAQSAAFLPALTNANFAYVQEPMPKGIETGGLMDRVFFQYAGVSRKDKRGLVQVGLRAERVAEAMKFANVDEIARTTRIGRKGQVRIHRRLRTHRRASSGVRRVSGPDGHPALAYEMDCEGYRITAILPEAREISIAEIVLIVIGVVCLVLVAFLLFFSHRQRLSFLRAAAAKHRRTNRGSSRVGLVVRVFTSPLAIAAFVATVILFVLLGLATTAQAKRVAKDRLRAAAADMVAQLDDCVDSQLAFIGREICEKFGTPEAMIDLDMTKLMETYFVDEINAVNANGLCVASTVPAIRGQDQWSLANPACFCRALLNEGDEVFSQPFRASATESHVYRKYVGVAFPAPVKGYLQVGFERSRLHHSIDYALRDLAHAWHIGEEGFFVISKTSNGEILSTRDERLDGKTLASVGFDIFRARQLENVESRDPVSRAFRGFEQINFFESEFNGVRCLCTSGVVNQFHRYVALMPLADVYGPARRNLILVAAVLFLIFALVVFFVSRLSDKNRALEVFISRDREQREKDLSVARTVQVSSLPLMLPETDLYRLQALMVTAREVGGDFYDAYVVPSGKLFCLIADVSGKGIPAAMFMMRARAIIRACAMEFTDFARAVEMANDRLSENNQAFMFVTAWFGLYDPESGVLEYVNAGHNPPVLRRADGSVSWVKGAHGPALALIPSQSFPVIRLELRPGDVICLYTDGVTEAMDAGGELYGEDRLETLMKSAGGDPIPAVKADVSAFVAGAEQSDDITMLTLECKGISKG